MVKIMLYERIKKEFNNSSDLKYKKINDVNVIYLESLCSSNSINDFILMNLTIGKPYVFLKDIVSGPNVIYLTNEKQISEYLLNGFALVYDNNDMLVCEVKGDLYRSVSEPLAETSVNGPKDAFNENIIVNLGLIKRRIKTPNLVNNDYDLGRKTKTN